MTCFSMHYTSNCI